jgi:Raf kinase inhibitor-like YbhB/YbcL family protein
MALKLTSDAFKNDGFIPADYSGEGRNISPPLRWSGVPEGTREFVLICEDPDAPQKDPFVHWLIYNVSPNTTFLPEGVLPEKTLGAPIRADQGKNSFGNYGYGGPLPPIGHGVHHYYFKLYALNAELGLKPGATKDELLDAIDGHILDGAQLMGKYIRETAEKAG